MQDQSKLVNTKTDPKKLKSTAVLDLFNYGYGIKNELIFLPYKNDPSMVLPKNMFGGIGIGLNFATHLAKQEANLPVSRKFANASVNSIIDWGIDLALGFTKNLAIDIVGRGGDSFQSALEDRIKKVEQAKPGDPSWLPEEGRYPLYEALAAAQMLSAPNSDSRQVKESLQ